MDLRRSPNPPGWTRFFQGAILLPPGRRPWRADGSAVAGGPARTRAKKERKPNKPRICQLCGQQQQKDYGHSQFGGITVELWLAEKRRTYICFFAVSFYFFFFILFF